MKKPYSYSTSFFLFSKLTCIHSWEVSFSLILLRYYLNAHNSEIRILLFLEFYVCVLRMEPRASHGPGKCFTIELYCCFDTLKSFSAIAYLFFCHMIFSNDFVSSGIIHVVYSISSLFILCQFYPQLVDEIYWIEPSGIMDKYNT